MRSRTLRERAANERSSSASESTGSAATQPRCCSGDAETHAQRVKKTLKPLKSIRLKPASRLCDAVFMEYSTVDCY